MAATAAGARPRRTWPQRLLIGFNVVLIVACLAGASGLGFLYYRFGQLPRIEFEEGVLSPRVDEPGEPFNFLLVGSDTREGQDASQFGTETQTAGARSDTMILIRIDPAAETAAMLSFPRDLYVEIAGMGRTDRINTAFNDGQQTLIETIKLNFNVPIHHYAQVDFDGFKDLVDTVGGIQIYLSSPVRDYGCDEQGCRTFSGLDIDETGCVTLDGKQALSYVRSRYFQEQNENGRWVTDPSGDIGRIERQQDFVSRALREALSNDLLNPVRLNSLVSVGIENVDISDSLGVDDIVDLGKRFRDLAPDTLRQYTLPTTPFTTSAGAAVLELQQGQETEDILNVFRGIETGDPAALQPSAVSVQVLNGSGRSNEATSATDGLEAAGFVVTATDTASTTDNPRTTILHGPDAVEPALLVSRYLTAGATLREDATLGTDDVVLVTGLDYEGVLSTPTPPDATVSTTTNTTDASTESTLSEEEAIDLWNNTIAKNSCT